MKFRLNHLWALLSLIVTWVVFSDSLAAIAVAQWSSNPNVNNAVVKAAGDQRSHQMMSDGAGGAYIVWSDMRRQFYADIYMQHFNSAGYPQWPADGILLSQGTVSNENTQLFVDQHPKIVSDGAGGAIVAWEDMRDTVYGLYSVHAQRIDAAGTIHWTPNGVHINAIPFNQVNPVLTEDGSGGAIIVWHDQRSIYSKAYAQRLNAAGAVQWVGGDVALSTDLHDESIDGIVSDDAGGAIVLWEDSRSGNNAIFAQRIDPTGTLLWQADGLPVAGDANGNGVICRDGSGGAVIAWQYWLGGDLYIQRISSTGFPQWAAGGMVFSHGSGSYPSIAATGTGSTIVAWLDVRNGFWDIYAQMVNSSGLPVWRLEGIPIDSTTNNINSPAAPAVISDGGDGALIAWQTYRSGGNLDVLAQRVKSDGTALWTTNGASVSTAPVDQFSPVICSDGEQGAIIAWGDMRNGSDLDIYTQRIDFTGEPGSSNPAIVAVRDIANDQGGKMRLLWTATSLDVAPKTVIQYYTIKLGVRNSAVLGKKSSQGPVVPDPIFWQTIGSIPADWSGGYSAVVPTVADSGLQGIPRYYVQVIAVADSNRFWKSNIDSGYSVDNIPPVGIAGASLGTLPGGQVRLKWQKDRLDPDLMGYYIYRGSAPGFVLNQSSRLTLTFDTTYTDPTVLADQNYFYRVVGVDMHGNQGSPSVELLKQKLVTEVENTIAPKEFTLVQNYPNPFNPSTTVEFTLAESGKTTVKIFDILGKEVATLFNQEAEAGRLYRIQFNASGLTSGIYVSVLESGGKRLVRRMALVK